MYNFAMKYYSGLRFGTSKHDSVEYRYLHHEKYYDLASYTYNKTRYFPLLHKLQSKKHCRPPIKCHKIK